MQLFSFNKKVPGDDECLVTPITALDKSTMMQQPKGFYTMELKNQAKTTTKRRSPLNLLGRRSDSRISNLDQSDESPRNKMIDARESSSRIRAAELCVMFELDDNDEHTTLNPVAVMPSKNTGPSLRSKIPQFKVKHTEPVTMMSQESHENPSNAMPLKSLNGISRRRSFDITKPFLNNFGLSQRNLSTSRLHVEEFDTHFESREDTDYHFLPFLHQDATGSPSRRDRPMSAEQSYGEKVVYPFESPRSLSALSQELPDMC
jgi:hypothetical protein